MYSNSKKKNSAVNAPVCVVPRKAIAVAIAACFSGTAIANPTGGVVAHGSAQITNPAANILNINTHTAKTIINWNSFSIGAGELTRITQPTALSAVLNRVVGSDPSAILGALQSNGRVFLLNPNGIVFGAGSQINVAGLVASSLNLSDADFLSGRMNFTNGIGAGSVANQGSINAAGGPVYLVGNSVTNNGLITNPNGEVVLAAGNSVELVNPATPNLRVEVVAPDNEAKNLGTISADAGRIGIYAGLIRQGGVINADSVVAEGGRILLKATKNTTLDAGSQTTASGTTGGKVEIQSGDTTLASGAIEAKGSSGAGGNVQVLGNKVGLIGNATIDASGDTGGGTVLVGGDFQGKNADVQNAYRSFVGQDVSLKADAITQGDGGKVIIWADDITRFYGDVSARGGANGGNGGFVEVSGKHVLDFQGHVSTLAPNGVIGTLLLDPDFIEVSASGDPTALPPVVGGVGYDFSDPGDAYGGRIIAPSAIESAGSNVILQANDNIDVNAPITMANAGVGITMQAGGIITVQNAITTKGGAITIIAGDPGASPSPSEGAIFLNGALDTTNATPAGANITLTSNKLDLGFDSIRLNASINAGTNGVVSLNNTSVAGITQVSGTITAKTIEAFNTAVGADPILLGGNNAADFVELSNASTSGITFKNTRLNSTLLAVDSGGNVTITNSNTNATVNLGGDINFGAGSTFSIDGSLLTSSGIRTITGGTLSSSNLIEVNAGQLNLNNTTSTLTDLVLSGGGISSTGPMSVSGAMFYGGGTLSGAGALNTGVGSTISMPAGSAVLNGKFWSNSGTVTLSGAGRLTLNNSATLKNEAGGIIDLTGSNSNPLYWSSGGNTFNNPGTLNKTTATAQTLDIGGTINNTGTLHVASGQLNLANNGTHTGTFDIDPGTALHFTAGTNNLNAGVSLIDTGALHVTGGTVNVNTALTLGATNPALNVTGGTLSAGSNIVLNNNFFWSGGTITGSGLLTTNALTDIAGSAPILSSKVWNNTGTIEIGGNERLTLTGASTLNNQAGGVINLTGTNANPIYWSSGGNNINNAGTLNKTDPVVQSLDVGGTINNTGVMHVAGGQLHLLNDGAHSGTFDVDPGAVLRFGAGTHQLNAGSAFTDTGALQITGGTVNVNTPLTFGAAAPNVTISGGVVGGASDLTFNTGFSWNGGTISGAGLLVTGSGSTTTIGGGSVTLSGKTWNNSGTIAIGGANRLTLTASSVLNNQAGGLIELNGSNSNPIYWSAGGNALNNAGTLNKLGATTQSLDIGGTINNAGLVHVAGGQLNLQNSGDPTGAFDIDAGAVLQINAGTHNLNAGVSFTDTGTLNIAGGTTNINAPLTFGATEPLVTMSSGIVSGGSDLTFNAGFNWNGGTISGPGLLVTGTSATTTIGGSSVTLSGKTWNNSGTIAIGGANRLTLTGSSVLNNQAAGLIELNGSNGNPIYWSAGGNTINNAGTLDKLGAATQTLDIGGTINNTGLLHVTSGQLNLQNSGTHTGTFEVHAGATLNFAGGTHNLNGGAATDGPGAITVSSPVNFNAGSSHGALLTLSLGSSTVNFSTGGTVDVFDLVQSGGTVTGSSPINITHELLWSGGTISGSGSLTTGAGVVANLGGTSVVFDQRTWNNSGNINFTGNGQLWLNNGAALNNLAGGQVTLAGTAANPIWWSSIGGNAFNNAGTLTKTSATNQTLNPFGTFNNSGTVQVNAGQLSFLDSGTHTGTFDVGSTATLNFSGGTHDLNSGANVAGLGTLAQSGGTVNFNAGSSIAPGLAGLSHTNGTMNIGSGVLTSLGGLTQSGGTVSISTGSTVSIGNLTQSGGTITGTSPIDVTSQYLWTGGTLAGTGKLTTGTGVVTNVSANSVVFDQRIWDNTGDINLSGNGQIWLNNGATLNNLSGGQMMFTGTAANPLWWSSTGSNTLNNAGTITKSSAGTQSIDVLSTVLNTGTMNVQGGTLVVVGMSDNQGNINLSPGTTFQKTGAFTNSGTIQGTGTVVVGAGNTLTNNGTIRPGTSPGLLTVTGNLALGSSSVLDIEINGTARSTQYDAIDVSGNVTLGGTMNVGYGAFTPVAGNQFSIIQAAGTVGGTFATINDPNALTPQITAGPAGIFKLGVLTGGLTWDGGASTLNWFDALNWSGDFVPTSANDVVIGTGVGTVLVSGVAEAKSLNSGSPLTLSSGSLTLTNPSQVNDLFTISGGSLLGSGSVVIGGSSGALAWSGGAMGAGGIFTLGAGRSGSLSGSLALNRVFQNNGILDLSSATLNGTGSMANAGTANFLSGAVNVNLPFSASGLTTINSGATVAFNSGSPVNLLNVNMNGGAIQGNDSVVVGGVMNLTGGSFGGSGTLTTTPGTVTNVSAPVALAANKTWNNSGTVNIGGTGTIDLGDATPAVFNNQAGATVNITSTAGWSFISDPISQAGQINNAGSINVNENTSWEAAFNNAAGGMLQIAGGKALSMQNGQNISGSLNIGPGGTLWVSERHGVDTVFNNVTIGGNGTLQVLGSSPVAKFTNVAAPGITLRLGSGGQVGIVNGSSSFGGLALDSPGFGTSFSLSDGVFAQTTGNLSVPSGASYSGSNNVYVAQAGDLIVPGVVSASPGSSMTLAAPAGNVKIVGGSVMADVINLFGSNVTVGDSSASAPSQVVAGSALTVQTQGTLKILGGLGTGASALVSSSGALTVSTDDDVILAGGSGAGAWAKLSGNPDVVLAMIGGAVRMDAGSGSGAYAMIESVSPTTVLANFPNLASGGYFVNGVEGVVYDAATGTGFVAGSSPAVLGSNLLVTYGLAGGGSLPPAIEEALQAPTQTLIVATSESTTPPESEQEKDVFSGEEKKDKKKEAPVCK